ncbi:hypothetical protein M083_4091 [Bacteroides fragilis str. 3986 T(B)9]|nr:hypothetical protein M083_4091 [Bacteroides fragilis str. 3986 T(B)9]EYA54007.1 hypothetical protein M114_0689 [Bacteroides fragilis str. 3986 N(B)22]EYA58541.1 hypothetical protein M112_0685 [Bacteroides fragilis str. 3986 T(B)13]
MEKGSLFRFLCHKTVCYRILFKLCFVKMDATAPSFNQIN